MAEFDRIRWRCRRGMLELDLVLGAFLRAGFEQLTPIEVESFVRMLDAADNDLWDWVSARAEPTESEFVSLVQRLQRIRIAA